MCLSAWSTLLLAVFADRPSRLIFAVLVWYKFLWQRGILPRAVCTGFFPSPEHPALQSAIFRWQMKAAERWESPWAT